MTLQTALPLPGEEQSGKVQDWTLLVRLLGLLRPYWRSVAFSVLCAVADMGFQILGPLVVSIAIDQYFRTAVPIRWLPSDPGRGILLLSLAYFAILAGGTVVQTLQEYVANCTGQKAMADFRLELFEHFQKLDIAFFDGNPVGRLVTRLTADVEALSEMFSSGIVGVLANLTMVVFFLACMLAVSVRLTLTLSAVLPVFVLLAILFRRIVTPAQQRVRILVARMNAMIAEHVNGIVVLQLFNRQASSELEFDRINHGHMVASKGWVTANAWFLPMMELMGTIAQAGLLAVGAFLLSGGSLTLGVLIAFLQYGARFLRPIQDLSERYGILQTSIVSAERLFRLLDTPAPPAQPCMFEDKPVLGTYLEFDHLWFAYQGEDWVLRDVSFRVEAGQSLAVVGHTGAGKTTLISLLLRFYEPQRGSIRLGGVDISSLSKAALRRHFGVVLQTTYVHEGSILDNIHFGLDEDGETRAHDASGHVHLEELIRGLPDGLQTQIVERGDNLSAGQKQLVGFARAIWRDPKMLILDEATSDIDVETEAKIQRALGGLLKGRTSMIIAHRLTTVLRADRILVLHKGQTRELGTHSQLLAQRGLYWRLFQLQFGTPDVAFHAPEAGEAVVSAAGH